MDKGDAFLMGVLKTRNKKKHLWVVISDPKKHSGAAIIVNISTDKNRTREECPLVTGEHPRLDEPTSWLCYGDAVRMTPSGWLTIQEGIAKGFIVPERKCPTACLEKIVAGAKASAAKTNGAFPKEFLKYLD